MFQRCGYSVNKPDRAKKEMIEAACGIGKLFGPVFRR
jgi:hypothetical protein